jgi:hypothetical protein
LTIAAPADEGMSQAEADLDSFSIDEPGAPEHLLAPPPASTARNLTAAAAPREARPGSIVRGDEDPLEALRRHHPGLLPVYAALTTETVRPSPRAARLFEDGADRLLDRRDDALEAPERLGR